MNFNDFTVISLIIRLRTKERPLHKPSQDKANQPHWEKLEIVWNSSLGKKKEGQHVHIMLEQQKDLQVSTTVSVYTSVYRTVGQQESEEGADLISRTS